MVLPGGPLGGPRVGDATVGGGPLPGGPRIPPLTGLKGPVMGGGRLSGGGRAPDRGGGKLRLAGRGGKFKLGGSPELEGRERGGGRGDVDALYSSFRRSASLTLSFSNSFCSFKMLTCQRIRNLIEIGGNKIIHPLSMKVPECPSPSCVSPFACQRSTLRWVPRASFPIGKPRQAAE